MMDRNELLDALENVHDFLKEIDDPGHKAVAMAAAYIAGELNLDGLARPMTLEEVRESKGFLWVEIRETGAVSKGIFIKINDEAAMVFHLRRPYWIGEYSAVLYGLRFRCWASKPTAEDMAAAEWEVDENG